MDIDAVFGKTKVWWDCLAPPAKTELDRVAAAIKSRDREPSWPEVLQQFRAEFPHEPTVTIATIRNTVRRRVETL